MPLMQRIFCFFIAIVLSLFVSSVPTHAYFTSIENFDTNLLPGFWQQIRTIPSFGSETGITYIKFGDPQISPFSYIRILDSLGVSYDSVEAKLKFLSGSVTQGAGLIFSDNVPMLNEQLRFNDLLFFIWPKPSGIFSLFTPLCPQINPACNQSFQIQNGIYDFPNDHNWHTILIKRIASHYDVYSDNQLIFSTLDTNRLVKSTGVGNPEEIFHSQIWPVFLIDYLKVVDTRIPTYPHYLSQKDPLWAGVEYDTASTWSPGKTGIDRWGCALTSVAMLLQNYDIKTPAGETVTPPILNTWLKSQPDGYVGPGLLNWLAVSRMVHQARQAGYSTTDLEYARSTYTPATIKTELDQNRPIILREAGHFVLSHGYDDSSWYLADPALETRTEASQSAAWISQHVYTPSSTDLSYFLFTAPIGTQVSLADAQGDPVPLEISEETLTDDVDGSGTTGAAMYLLPKPSSGTYLVTTQNTLPTPIEITGYWYDTEGNVGRATYPVDAVGTMQYRLVYDKTSTVSGSLAPLDTTPPSSFDLIAPTDTARMSVHDITFSWAASSDTTLPLTYQLLVYDAQNQVVVDKTLAELTAVATLPDGTYTWIVRACDSVHNCTDSNGMRTFTIAPTPLLPAPRLIMAESLWKNIFLVWQNVRGAHHYLVQYGADKNHLDKTVVSRDTHAWISVPKKGTYYLSVSAVDTAGNVGTASKIVTVYAHGMFYPRWHFWR